MFNALDYKSSRPRRCYFMIFIKTPKECESAVERKGEMAEERRRGRVGGGGKQR